MDAQYKVGKLFFPIGRDFHDAMFASVSSQSLEEKAIFF